MMPSTTQVALVLDALVAKTRVHVPDDVVVYDGQPTRKDDPDVLIIGWSPSGPAVEISQDVADMGGGRSERLSISGVASAMRGETDEASVRFVRARVVELLDLLVAAIEADPSLGGVVSEAAFGFVGALDQRQTTNGPAASIGFTILADVL